MLTNFVSTQNSTENSTNTGPAGPGSAVIGGVGHLVEAGGGGPAGGGSRIVVQNSAAGPRVCSVSGGPRELPEHAGSGSEDTPNAARCTGNKENCDNNSTEVKQSSTMSPFSMPGVLHFLQQEWGRYELDRAQWEIERTELKARISFLIGERKSQENLKHDLVRRIKMLEYALKQERTKFQQLADSQENHDKTAINLEEEEDDEQQQDFDATKSAAVSSVPFDIDAILPPPPQHLSSAVSVLPPSATAANSANAAGARSGAGILPSAPPSSVPSDQAWAHARETLRHYLQEIGYTEHMLEARCYRVKQLLGIHQLGGDNNKGNSDGQTPAEGERGDAGGTGAAKLHTETEKALLESEQAILEAADSIVNKSTIWKNKMPGQYTAMAKCAEESDCSSSDDQQKDQMNATAVGEFALDAEAEDAIGEFAFLHKSEKPQQQREESIQEMKRLYKEQMERRREKAHHFGAEMSKMDRMREQAHHMAEMAKFSNAAKRSDKKGGGGADQQPSRQQPQQQFRHISVDTVHGIPPTTVDSVAAAQQKQHQILLTDDDTGGEGGEDVEKFADIKSGFEDDDDDTVQQLRWNIHYTLRSHYDSVRAMQFHPVEPMLITASEDGTAKLWDLNHSSVGGAKNDGGAGAAAKNAQSAATGIVDIEPLYTFRGHRGPILALDLAPLGETCYTGGLDGTICCWTVPQMTGGLDIYQTFDPSVLQERLCGHTDAVWCLCFHSASNRLISASADGTIKIWIVGLADGAMPSPLLKTIQVSSADDEAAGTAVRPHSIDLISTSDRRQLLCAYQGGGVGVGTRRCYCNIRDLETGQVVVNFQLGCGDDQPSALNKILSHPTMPVSIAAGEDRKIRFFDNNTGKLISAPMAHVEGVSTLAIDPNGLYMLSGSHDGSMRLWNAEKRVCLQEIAAHRKKFGAGVMAVAFHPSRQLIGSSGADSLAKVYSPIRQSPRSSVVAAFGTSPSSSPGSSGPSSVVGSPQKSSPISSAATPVAKGK
ncbi:hypothetical protein niasHT_020096 [Heterodera trifolii]|uniref:Striatin N-terminal domain-containing protein n=1 Tax=Heterodera trifolii TaxID=157864 RepID=A0ABD2LJW5_9BILA